MTVGAYGAGALPGGPDGRAGPAGALAASWPYWLGLTGWLAGLLVLTVAWWRLGGTLHRPGHPVPTRWLLATGALWAAPLLFAPPLGSRDVYAYACQGALWLDGVDPYAVGVADGGCAWTDSVPSLWWHTTTPYGPLAIALAGGVVALARLAVSGPDDRLLVAIFLFRAVAMLGALLVARYLPRLARAVGAPASAAVWLALLSPLTAVHLVGGAHNDALMVGLVVAALALAVGATRTGVPEPGPAPSGRPWPRPWPALLLAGLLLGLAGTIKITALVALPFVALLATVRLPRTLAPATVGPPGAMAPGGVRLARAVAVGAVLLTTAVTFATVTVATGLDLGWLAALPDTGRLVQWTSLPSGLGMAAGYLLRILGHPEAFGPAVAWARALGLAVLLAVSVALVLRAWRATGGRPGVSGHGWETDRPPVAARRSVTTACGLAFGAVTLLSPVFYPWYALATVTVLAATVGQRWWRGPLAVLVLATGFLVLPDGLGLAVRTKLPGALLDVAVVIALTAYAVRRFRRARRPRANQPDQPARPDQPAGPCRLTGTDQPARHDRPDQPTSPIPPAPRIPRSRSGSPTLGAGGGGPDPVSLPVGPGREAATTAGHRSRRSGSAAHPGAPATPRPRG